MLSASGAFVFDWKAGFSMRLSRSFHDSNRLCQAWLDFCFRPTKWRICCALSCMVMHCALLTFNHVFRGILTVQKQRWLAVCRLVPCEGGVGCGSLQTDTPMMNSLLNEKNVARSIDGTNQDQPINGCFCRVLWLKVRGRSASYLLYGCAQLRFFRIFETQPFHPNRPNRRPAALCKCSSMVVNDFSPVRHPPILKSDSDLIE